MFVVVEKVEKKLYVYGVFDCKESAEYWLNKRKQEPPNKRRYLKRTYSIHKVL